MAKILLIDDNGAICNLLSAPLTDREHEVKSISKSHWANARDLVVKELALEWDILVFDIHYDTDKNNTHQGEFGGIWIYNDLMRRGLRGQWGHTIVYSKYVPEDWNVQSTNSALILRVFLETADIPLASALSSATFDVSRLSDRIDDLV